MNTNLRIILAALMISIMVVLMGCTALNVVSDLKGQDDVMDVSIILKNHAVYCDVILNADAKVIDAEGLAVKSALQVRTQMPDQEINLRVLQNKSVIASCTLERD